MTSQTLTPLGQLLHFSRPSEAPVAFGRESTATLGDFRGRVAATCDAIKEHPEGSWIVHCHDSYAAAISFFALLHAGRSALLLPSRQPGVFEEFAPEAVGALLDDTPASAPARTLPCIDPLGQTAREPNSWPELQRDAVVARFMTSGSSGQAKAIPKRLRHLEDEIFALEEAFGPDLSAHTRVFATVSPQHIYGLLFRVLWPLCAGRPFWREHVLHPEEFLPWMENERESLLATSPVLLKSPKLQRGLARVRESCRLVFSSGGPLQAETAHAIHGDFGRAPWEVLGSTETGGIARRQRTGGTDPSDELWTPLPGVAVTTDPATDRMVIRSAFVSVGEASEPGAPLRLVGGDRIDLRSPQAFVLLGRADRIVKIGEKRLALPEMEETLLAHEWVEDAALTVLQSGGIERVHALVALADASHPELARRGRREVGRILGDSLRQTWDAVLVPRIWRFCERLPRDPQGKISARAVRQAFEDSGSDTGPLLDPVLLQESRLPRTITRNLRVPDELAFLDGHFPGQPIVAGVVQLRWAIECAEEWLGARVEISRIDALKFHSVLRPADAFALTVKLSETGDRLDVRLADGDRVFSTARCRLTQALEPPEFSS